MNLFPSALPMLAASCLVLGLLVVYVRGRRPARKRGFVEISPRYRSFFRQHGLTDAEHFLGLPGEVPHIVSGHPDRHVARMQLGTGPRRWTAFLKCEHRVTWRTRLRHALGGFGFRSRSLRKARTLQALGREGMPGPEWLAAGEDGRGRAFVLVREVAGVELRAVLRAEKDSARRRRIARNLGAALARLHGAGFRHPDLYANHVFVDQRRFGPRTRLAALPANSDARLARAWPRSGRPARDARRYAGHAARTSDLSACVQPGHSLCDLLASCRGGNRGTSAAFAGTAAHPREATAAGAAAGVDLPGRRGPVRDAGHATALRRRYPRVVSSSYE